ncbi:MAG TPA: GNAT family N-acetyltransferase [Flavobacteriales bacterium]|nr:GNAT family N-acetyltransferase [Flavobacteriales bacterium]HNA34506.1 GNAT family N-acetyltransferase [Flavobacteriales bacterium]HNE80315.1 GNAT family N-acetyltransferase [Flavobacteriales bacterium]HNI05076.1 GNAT family N-acetyltransferase [Flavobacteriales bacterium]HNK39995.1 GNAT family N-acetyltransferase [Flavobacteriales bacterium]
MSNFTVRAVQRADDPALAKVPALFGTMHAEMAEQGMGQRLAPDGGRTWLDGVIGGLERFGRIAVAEWDGEVIGFAHAAVKLAPEHLGGGRIGHVTHLYVTPAHRRSGIARALAASLHEWLRTRSVLSIELQVVHRNEAGLAFWRSLGYAPELLQMRKH